MSTNCYYLYTELKFLKGQLFKWCFFVLFGGFCLMLFSFPRDRERSYKKSNKEMNTNIANKNSKLFLINWKLFLTTQKSHRNVFFCFEISFLPFSIWVRKGFDSLAACSAETLRRRLLLLLFLQSYLLLGNRSLCRKSLCWKP